MPGITPPSQRMAVLEQIREHAAWAKPQELEPISSQLAAVFRQETDPILRAEIVRVLGVYPTATSLAVLRMAVGDRDAEVRIAACLGWGRRKGPEAVGRHEPIVSRATLTAMSAWPPPRPWATSATARAWRRWAASWKTKIRPCSTAPWPRCKRSPVRILETTLTGGVSTFRTDPRDRTKRFQLAGESAETSNVLRLSNRAAFAVAL